jgi:GrpB-like predicted nucleotidyltransferase (UPF0157 family)
MESLEERIRRVTAEPVEVVDYDPGWPAAFDRERQHLLSCLPSDLVVRIEHFGSTAVPGLATVREHVVSLLESQGYEYFWRPTFGDDGEPFYAWFIKRDPASGKRTHHIHMVERTFASHWDRLLFRDYLIAHPDVAAQYGLLKREIATAPSTDRVRYTAAKGDFIQRFTDIARRESKA